ncbi:hypothetical protein FIBSPDRAFT_904490 [Athelia psychrophila]|uniref:Uncharacterized protein n=1 Tax=Athelia psychrophila TaxID=1759441 RepID=A0A167UPG2_9AGAM|nr:hypothetical protein FIBSPDRAFT_904490 [Fibularhizoctonia sp. CBS 109695]
MFENIVTREDLHVKSALLKKLEDPLFDFSMPTQCVSLTTHEYDPALVSLAGRALIEGISAVVMSNTFILGYPRLFTVMRRALSAPDTIFHLMRKTGAVVDVTYSAKEHEWVIELFYTQLGLYTFSHSIEAGEAWISGALMPLIIASKRAAEDYQVTKTRAFQTRMEKDVLLGLSITEDEWLMLHGALPNHSGRDYAPMPRRILRTATTLRVSPYGSRSTNTTPARSSGTNNQHPSSRLKENLNAANQSHSKFSGQMNTLEKGKGRLSNTSSSPWYQGPASHPPAPGLSSSIFPGVPIDWVPASHPAAPGPLPSIIPTNWVPASYPPAPGLPSTTFQGVMDWVPASHPPAPALSSIFPVVPYNWVTASYPPAPGPSSIFQGVTDWVPASHPPAPGPLPSVIPTNWVPASYPPALGPSSSIFQGVPTNWQPLTQSQPMTHSDNYSGWRSLPNWE